jgi:hypothetical protein
MTKPTTTINRELLVRAWVHAHEQDHDGLLVFKPLGEALPPSRGRRILDLSENGAASLGMPGADDRSATTKGAWHLEGDHLRIESAQGTSQQFLVTALQEDELAMRRIS